jgi:hypothetical protein
MALDTFEIANQRSERFLTLYKLMRNSRQRGAREDWLTRFKQFMRWPAGEQITRIDGHDGNSMIILREAVGITRDEFEHDILSELLRAAIVASVSALDRYMHDLVMRNVWSLLDQSEEDMSNELKKLSIPAYEVKRALTAIRQEPNARPGGKMKKVIQATLHRNHTFQRPDDLQKAAKMIGIDGFWDQVEAEFPGNRTKKQIIDQLKKITIRRNQIVHEADIIVKIRNREINTRTISERDATRAVEFIGRLVRSIDRVAQAA